MSDTFSALFDLIGSSDPNLLKLVGLGYVGLLWVSIIIWVTRDSIQRSNNLFFQTFSILLNILIPFLGVLLYLIIRPGKTSTENYYEELEHRLLADSTDDKNGATCAKCLTTSEHSYMFCPNCGEKMKQSCEKCRKPFPNVWGICPFCGEKQSHADTEEVSSPKITKKKMKKA